jgi:hypothetical protein
LLSAFSAAWLGLFITGSIVAATILKELASLADLTLMESSQAHIQLIL